jgi:TolB protein
MIKTPGIILRGLLITIVTALTAITFNTNLTTAQVKNQPPAASPDSPQQSYTPDSRRGAEAVAFATFRPGNWDVYYFASRGSQPRRLTDDPRLDYDAVLSPDGRWVVFCSERSGTPALYVLDLQHEGPPKLLIDGDEMTDQAAFSQDGKTLAFVSDHDGTADIFVMPFNPEKTQSMEKALNLTRHNGGEFRPAFSPDGKKIAFSTEWDVSPTGKPAERSREGEIYLMDADGKNIQRLTRSPGWDGSPRWSPDGRTIYFYSKRDHGFRIWAMDADGGNPRAISPKGLEAISPVPTPDGRLAFAAKMKPGENADWKIVSVALNGTDQRLESDTSNSYWIPDFNAKSGAMVCFGPGPNQKISAPGEGAENLLSEGPFLTANSPSYVDLPDRTIALYPVRKFGLALDPSGQKLALTDSFYSSHYIAVTDLDGTNEKIIFERKDRKVVPPVYVPVWSKDGSWIAWMSGLPFGGPKEDNDIWKMHPDGSGAVNLTPDSPGSDGFADFSGDGRQIVFRSGRTGNFDVYLMNSDGTNVRNLTNNPAYDSFPAFSPLNDEIAFASNRDGDLDEKTGMKTFDIYTLKIKPDGSPGELRRITNTPGQDSHPRYSPDGKWLVFASERGSINDEEPLIQELFFQPQSYGEIYAVRLSDLTFVRLTHNKWEDGTPSWGGPNKR